MPEKIDLEMLLDDTEHLFEAYGIDTSEGTEARNVLRRNFEKIVEEYNASLGETK